MEESNKMMISAKYVEFLCAHSRTKSDEQKKWSDVAENKFTSHSFGMISMEKYNENNENYLLNSVRN